VSGEVLSGVDYGRIKADASELLKKLLLQQCWSRHPTGTPFFIETCERANAWCFEQIANGTGEFKIVSGLATRIGGQQGPPYTAAFNGKTMIQVLSSGINWGYLNMNYMTAILPNLRLGFEVFFAIPYTRAQQQTRLRRWHFGFNLHDVNNQSHEAEVTFDPINQRLQLYRTAGALEPMVLDLSGNRIYGSENWLIWQNAKLIVDFGTGRFVKLFWNEHEVDLSNHEIYHAASIQAPRLSSIMIFYDVGAAIQYYMYVGGVILTMEEP
jgi:hypothetical protein